MSDDVSVAQTADGLGSVLIVGDWFVDEHWVVGIHRSSSSSRIGRRHRRSLHPLQDEIRAFCGAGRSAYLLNQMTMNMGGEETGERKKAFDRICGVGFWHELDTEALETMFDHDAQSHLPYALTPSDLDTQSADAHVRLVNMHRALTTKGAHDKQFTDRIVRIYETDEDGKISYERIDWEAQLRKVAWNDERLNKLKKKIETALKDAPPLTAVVIKDLRKNAIADKLIEYLAVEYGKSSDQPARWYVSSKAWNPVWLKELSKVNLEFLMIPEVAASDALEVDDIAVSSEEQLISSWLSSSGKPTNECLKVLKHIHELVGEQGIVLVSPDGYQVVARAPKRGNPGVFECIVQSELDPVPIDVPMGGASIFFPALAACLEYRRRMEPEYADEFLTNKHMIRHALVCTLDWVRAETKRVTQPPARWESNPTSWSVPRLLDIDYLKDTPPNAGRFATDDWVDLEKEWEDASNASNQGVVKINGVERIQLWRGAIEVSGYAAWKTPKRLNIKRLKRGIQAFSQDAKYHQSAMLKADPGAGKTFLVKRLAQETGLTYLPFNVTHVTNRGDVIEWFNQILGYQSEHTGSRCLIFVDEINADLVGGKVYGSFLSPMDDGTFVQNGRTYHLEPCVWIFAGTESPAATTDPSQKGADFDSRLTLGTIDVSEPNNVNEALENIYMGVSLLRHEFPDVKMISRKVIESFVFLEPGSVRDLKNFVRNFSQIQYGKVLAANVPVIWPGDADGARRRTWLSNSAKENPYEEQILIE